MKRLLLISIVGAGIGCQGDVTVVGEFAPASPTNTIDEKREVTDPEVESEPAPAVNISLTASEATQYMSTISQLLIARPINVEERAQLEAEQYAAIRPILESWTTDVGFPESMAEMMKTKLKTSGTRNEIDFELPGNLVRHIAANDLPVSEILTAPYCIDSAGETMTCDSGAPYAAGVLTTRAYLSGTASRFNLNRASTMMRVFACRIYPMEDELQPRAEKPDLIEMFRAETPEEQTVEEAKDAFGNGGECYTCHGQFGLHAQLFVKYDQDGLFVQDADGVQDPNGELGRSLNGLMTSHMEDITRKGSEQSQMFGQEIANLAEAGSVLAESDIFMPCMIRNMLEHTFGLTESESESMRHDVLEKIAETMYERDERPSLADMMVETFSTPEIVRSVVPEEAP